MRNTICGSLCFVMALCAMAIGVERVTLDKPVKITAVKIDKSKVTGDVVAFDDFSFDLKIKEGADPETINWNEFDAKTIFMTYSQLIPKGTGEQWSELGEMLLNQTDGASWADKAFAKALKLDPKLKERIDEAKKAAAEEAAKPKEGEGGGAGGKDAPPKDGEGKDGAAAGGPVVVGDTEEKWWGKLTDKEQAESVDTLKKFADETKSKVNNKLVLYETDYFLFYSDLKKAEAEKWGKLLDKMYARLCSIFGVEKGSNVWRGKGLIFVFQYEGDYMSFQEIMHDTDASGSAGMCHSFGDGMVHIAFYRQSDENKFAHVLVHESVHGFIHRYKSPAHVPSWANEGLAEVIASELVPVAGYAPQLRNKARNYTQEYEGGRIRRSYFTGSHIQGYEYPIAEYMCGFMIQQGKKRYVDFINGIKDGMDWEKALSEKYGVESDKLGDAVCSDLGVRKTN